MSKNKSSCFGFLCTSGNCVCTAKQNIANLSNDELLRLITAKSTEQINAIIKSNQKKINELNQNISFLESIQQNRLKKAENKLKTETNKLAKFSNILNQPLNKSIPKSITRNIKKELENLEVNQMYTKIELNIIDEEFRNGKLNKVTYENKKKSLKNKLNNINKKLSTM